MRSTKGFSLVELIVSIAIMGFIMGVVLYNMPQFNRNILMNQAIRQIASTLRDAEERSVAVVQNGVTPGQSYGVYFDTTSGSDFIIFSDCNNNLKYEVSGSCGNESVKNYSFTQGVHIKSLFRPQDGLTCFTVGGCPVATGKMHVIFSRPDPSINISDGSGNCISGVSTCSVSS